MRLIFIYGPPATGKLTVAKELAKLTKYKIFHNHLTVDLIGSVLKFGTKTFLTLVQDSEWKCLKPQQKKT